MRWGFVSVLFASLLMGKAIGQAKNFYLHDGDRVTFYGDSITAQRFYTRDVQDFVETRYPRLKVDYHNAGVPGDKVSGGYAGGAAERVDRDVRPWDPTVITVMLGVNDGDYIPPDANVFAEYQSGYEKLLSMLHQAAPHARVTLLENTPYDEITHGTEFAGFMATTEQNAHATPALGRREDVPVVDSFSPMIDLLSRAKAANPSFASLLVTDRIHPAEPSHWIIAEALMKTWNVDPVVSKVALSAKKQAVLQSSRTSVSGLSGDQESLQWSQTDEALPLPFNFDNALMNFVLSISDLAAYDQEMLQINELAQGSYQLTIDSTVVGTFSSAQLAMGINLGTMKTPLWQQARDYDAELEQRSDLERASLILSAGTKVEDRAAGEKILREGEVEFDQHAAADLNIPAHHYMLKRVKDVSAKQ
jgi:lysophospholipase L1-like esterase